MLDVLLSARFTHVPKAVVPHAFCKQAKLRYNVISTAVPEGGLALLCPSRARLSGSEIGTIRDPCPEGATTFIAPILT